MRRTLFLFVLPDYVDAFYGPAEWKTQAEKEKAWGNGVEAHSIHTLSGGLKGPAFGLEWQNEFG